MKKIFALLLIMVSSFFNYNTNDLRGIVIFNDGQNILIQDNKNIIYSFENDIDAYVGNNIYIKYKNENIIEYKTNNFKTKNIPSNWNDEGIFSDYYGKAYKKLKTLSIDEKIGQLIVARYDENIENLKKYDLGGYVFFAKDFRNKTKNEVITMISDVQRISKIPLITSVDEEGGKVIRISSNPNLSNNEFKSPREIYTLGGLEAIKEDTITKIKLLSELGLNVNLAPVVDISTNPDDYMYERSIGQSMEITSEFAKTVISTSKNSDVSFTLKHFPGYGNNVDTHTGTAYDERNFEDILNAMKPFEAGINAGAEVVLISHNIVTSVDDKEASLSYKVHNLLRDNLNFTGIIITDDLSMGATKDIENYTVKALLAGNDMLIVTDYEKSIEEIKQALDNNIIDEALIDKLCFRVLAWKYYKGLM